MPFKMKLASFSMAAVMAVSMLATTVGADQPYDGYNYDWWGDAVPSQAGYIVDEVVSGINWTTGTRINNEDVLKEHNLEATVEIGSMDEPNDFFIDQKTKKAYIVDTKMQRIIITDLALSDNGIKVIDQLYNPETKQMETLNNPHGIYIFHDSREQEEAKQEKIYIADRLNERVVACYSDGTIFKIYTRPTSELYESTITFEPRKVVVDKAGNVYIAIKSTTQGAVVFDSDGNFTGYFGANRVVQTADVIANQFWKLIMSREAVIKMKRNVSVEFSNFDIDEDGFIYTVTELKNTTTDVFKKLNPAGFNIFTNLGYDQYTYGDFNTPYWQGTQYGSAIVDVDVDEKGIIRLLDFENGRIFEYSDECELLFTYGGIGTQKGLFNKGVTAIEAYNDIVYVLDSRKNSITTFRRTEFGEIVHEAMSLFASGKYAQAKAPWQEVLKRDSNYWFAYIGLGNAELSEGNYEEAMDYFYRNSRGGYNRAFKQYRMEFIRENFNLFMIIILVVVIALVGVNFILKRRRKKKKIMAGGE